MKLSGRGGERQGKGNSFCFVDADGEGTGHLLLQRAAVVAASMEETVRRVSDLFVPCAFISCYLHDPVILEQRKLRCSGCIPVSGTSHSHSSVSHRLMPPCPCNSGGWVKEFYLNSSIPFQPADLNMRGFARNTTLRSSSSINQGCFTSGEETAKFKEDALCCCTQFGDTSIQWQLCVCQLARLAEGTQ